MRKIGRYFTGSAIFMLSYYILRDSPLFFGQYEQGWYELIWVIPLIWITGNFAVFVNNIYDAVAKIPDRKNCEHDYSIWDRNVVNKSHQLYKVYKCCKCAHEIGVKHDE